MWIRATQDAAPMLHLTSDGLKHTHTHTHTSMQRGSLYVLLITSDIFDFLNTTRPTGGTNSTTNMQCRKASVHITSVLVNHQNPQVLKKDVMLNRAYNPISSQGVEFMLCTDGSLSLMIHTCMLLCLECKH